MPIAYPVVALRSAPVGRRYERRTQCAIRDGHSGSQLPCLAPAESGRCLGIYGHLKKVSAHYTCARICVTLVTPFSVANINGGKHAAESADSKGWSTGYLCAWIRKCSKKRLHNAHLFQSGLVDTVGQLDTASAVPCESLAPMSTATRVRLTKTRAHTYQYTVEEVWPDYDGQKRGRPVKAT